MRRAIAVFGDVKCDYEFIMGSSSYELKLNVFMGIHNICSILSNSKLSEVVLEIISNSKVNNKTTFTLGPFFHLIRMNTYNTMLSRIRNSHLYFPDCIVSSPTPQKLIFWIFHGEDGNPVNSDPFQSITWFSNLHGVWYKHVQLLQLINAFNYFSVLGHA